MTSNTFPTGAADFLVGSEGNDAIAGLGGDDKILGKAGNDLLFGNDGNDLIEGGEDVDLLDGGSGDDTLIGDTGDDFILAGAGNDRMIWNNGDGSDFMRGDQGYDVTEVNGAKEAGDAFELRAISDRADFERVNLGNFRLNIKDVEAMEINGGGGDDSLIVEDLSQTDIEKVTFKGGKGNDTLDASASTQTIMANGGKGNDFLSGGSAEDVLRGGAGDDTLIGRKGDDEMRGGKGNDRMIWNNGDGSDKMRGGAGQDVTEVNGALEAGDEFELGSNGQRVDFRRVNLGQFQLDINGVESMEINGGGGDDSVTVQSLARTNLKQVNFDGGDGNDFLNGSGTDVSIVAEGGDGNDILIGGSADDILIGGNGADLLIGGGGNDILNGGLGADIFLFRPSFVGVSVIGDFNADEDMLQFQQDMLPQSRMGSADAMRDSITYNSSNGAIAIDGVQIATLEAPVGGFDINSNVEFV